MSELPQAVIDAAAEEANIARWRARLVLEAAAPYIAAADRERVDKLAALAGRLLSASMFYDAGHPGRPCHRTGWVDDQQLADWRKELADLLDQP